MSATIETLTDLSGQGLVRSERHPVLPITVWCTNDPWDDDRAHVHGLVVHDDGRIVGRGLPKFRSVREQEPIRNERFIVVDMIDGIGIHAAMIDGELVLWTKDSFSGVHLDVAREMLTGWRPREGTTVLFEGVFQFDRRKIDYGPFEGLVLIAEIDHESGRDWLHPEEVSSATGWWGEVAIERSIPLHMLRKFVDNTGNGEGFEGFVLVYPRRDAPALRLSARFSRHE